MFRNVGQWIVAQHP